MENGPQFQVFLANFLLRMCKSDHKTISGQIFNPKFYTPIGHWQFPIRLQILLALTTRFMRVLSQKWLS